ncbi:hypothetical protein PFISCL1PPCAC_5588, partial [Pristionchus fissidentatus]
STFRDLTVIVYNKTRKLAGHTFKIQTPEAVTVAELKKEIEKTVKVPSEVQWISFGAWNLSDEVRLIDVGVRSGYTIYSTPTLVEIPNMPNL